MQRRHSLATFPTWAPAFAGVADWFAGVVLGLAWRGAELQLAASPRSLYSREGGSPVWVPAFAGKHFSCVREFRF